MIPWVQIISVSHKPDPEEGCRGAKTILPWVLRRMSRMSDCHSPLSSFMVYRLITELFIFNTLYQECQFGFQKVGRESWKEKLGFIKLNQKAFCRALKMVRSQLPLHETICKISSPKITIHDSQAWPFSFVTTRTELIVTVWQNQIHPAVRLSPPVAISQVLRGGLNKSSNKLYHSNWSKKKKITSGSA